MITVKAKMSMVMAMVDKTPMMIILDEYGTDKDDLVIVRLKIWVEFIL